MHFRRKVKKAARKKTTRKTIFEIYEPSELKRGHFTDLDNQVRILFTCMSTVLYQAGFVPVMYEKYFLDKK